MVTSFVLTITFSLLSFKIPRAANHLMCQHNRPYLYVGTHEWVGCINRKAYEFVAKAHCEHQYSQTAVINI